MINILFFIPGLSEGGAEKVLCNLVNSMDQSKFNITVQTMDEFNSSKYLVKGIHYKAINHCKSAKGKKLFSYWFRFCAELKTAYRFYVKEDYDIEVAYLETEATKIIAQSTNKNAAKIAWVHCDLSKKEGMDAALDKVRAQYKKFDQIVCVSEDVKAGFHKVFGKDFPTVVLHNVIDEQEIFEKAERPIEWEKDESKTQLLAVGRLTQQKNFSYLIDTCKKIKADGLQFHLNILGEGPERNNLEGQIGELALDDVVTLRGFISNPYPWMKKADLIVCSSRYEGISTVVQEALILGKPVVTTPCTGMEELLGNSEFGVISEDSPDGLYNSLKAMIESPAMYKRYQKQSVKRGNQIKKAYFSGIIQNFFIDCIKDKRSG